MSNFDRAVKALNDVDEFQGALADNNAYVTTLEARGLLANDPQVIHTAEELEALELDDADAIVVASEAGAVRTARVLWEMNRSGAMWGLPAVVLANGGQVRAAREALELINE